MFVLPLSLLALAPEASASCIVTQVSPLRGATLTTKQDFSFVASAGCASATLTVAGWGGAATPRIQDAVGPWRRFRVQPTDSEWEDWTLSSRTQLTWMITATDTAGAVTTHVTTNPLDTDGDGWTRGAGDLAACDADSTRNPGVAEVCDSLDNDCDGWSDVGATDAPTWYADADRDGYGDPSTSTASCSAPAWYRSDATDCDDGVYEVHPDATEVVGDGVDQDCDGADTTPLGFVYADCFDGGVTEPAGVGDLLWSYGPSGALFEIADLTDTTIGFGITGDNMEPASTAGTREGTSFSTGPTVLTLGGATPYTFSDVYWSGTLAADGSEITDAVITGYLDVAAMGAMTGTDTCALLTAFGASCLVDGTVYMLIESARCSVVP